MSTTARRAELETEKAFFCRTNQGKRFIDTGQHPLGNRPALIQQKRQGDTTFTQPGSHGFGAFASDFFVSAEAEIDIARGHKTFAQQTLGRLQYPHQTGFVIQRPTAPDITVNQRAAERRVAPVLFRTGNHRHNVLMRNQHNRLGSRISARPMQQQAVIKTLYRECFKHLRETLA